jgi:hypothetical protein
LFSNTADIFSGAVEVRPQKFRVNFIQCSAEELSDLGNFAQIGRNSPEIFEVKLNCADSPISGEKKLL